MTLEKPPWGKLFGREILLWRSQDKIATRKNNKGTWYNIQLLELGFGFPWEMHPPWDLHHVLSLLASMCPYSNKCAPHSSFVPLPASVRPYSNKCAPHSSFAPWPGSVCPYSNKCALTQAYALSSQDGTLKLPCTLASHKCAPLLHLSKNLLFSSPLFTLISKWTINVLLPHFSPLASSLG
jgi:hypothetical protein